MLTIRFHGAVQTVTGSCHLLEIDGTSLLLDCGLFQGRRAESMERNSTFPFDPAGIDAVLLSHAHIDHSGKLPMLVRLGFAGTIFSTHATRDLANIMLLDSAHIQEKDAEFVTKKNAKQGLPPVESLYRPADVLPTIEQFQTVGYRRRVLVAPGVHATFFDAGHILGSAQIVLDIARNGSSLRLAFTGDLGRPNRPIIRDPDDIGAVDILISEGTYGGRTHLDPMSTLDRLEDIIKRTAARSGKVIVPAFSVGRTQELVYDLHMLQKEGRLPDIPLYVDSPLSVNATEVYRIHPECMDPDVSDAIMTRNDPFGFGKLRYISSVEDSKALNDAREPMLIISASGMCEAGRILHHLANSIENPRNTILITGFNAPHTLGRKLVEKEPVVKIFGEDYKVRAEIEVLNSLSAHADRNELVQHISRLDRERLRQVFLVHGDPDQLDKLRATLTTENGIENVVIPEDDRVWTLE
ncbi:MAG: MBL fold metallo-hydrolase [Bacteroidota bacterium]|nr:MBL fold metallo-hydrolase [Bacteroidota bacterium]